MAAALVHAEPAASTAPLPSSVLCRLGPFDVGPDGTLSPSGACGSVRFAFLWRGRRVQAELGPGRRVRFAIAAARIPYTAEQPRRRASALAAVLALRAGGEPNLAAVLTPAHEVRLEEEVTLQATTASNLVAAAVRFVLRAEPYLQLLEEEGAVSPG